MLLLKQVDSGLVISCTLAACFKDDRDSFRLEQSADKLVRHSILALVLGCEDLNDQVQLRRGALLAAILCREDPATGSAGKR